MKKILFIFVAITFALPTMAGEIQITKDLKRQSDALIHEYYSKNCTGTIQCPLVKSTELHGDISILRHGTCRDKRVSKQGAPNAVRVATDYYINKPCFDKYNKEMNKYCDEEREYISNEYWGNFCTDTPSINCDNKNVTCQTQPNISKELLKEAVEEWCYPGKRIDLLNPKQLIRMHNEAHNQPDNTPATSGTGTASEKQQPQTPATSGTDTTETTLGDQQPQPTEENSQEQDDVSTPDGEKHQMTEEGIQKLNENYQNMKDNEKSFLNKSLGSVTMAATGAGGMMLAQGLTEQKADASAEQDMKAYLSTLYCKYGNGTSVEYGQTNVQVSGGNELTELSQKYKALAVDLKQRKEALGMKSGIESELVLDAAETGLYNNASTGKKSGAFTSLYRALTDETSEDATAWNAQKEKSAKMVKTGAIVAGVGVAVGVAGNIAINHNKGDKSKEILNNKKYWKDVQDQINALPEQTTTCVSGSTGTYPDCTCDNPNHTYNRNANKCEPDTQEETPTCQFACEAPSESNHLTRNDSDCSCGCKDGYTYKDNKCVCESTDKDTKASEDGGICTYIQTKTDGTTITITTNSMTLNSSTLFKIGESNVTEEAKTMLTDFAKTLGKNYKNCTVTIEGYTDPVGTKKTNQALSQKRAEAVKDILVTANSSAITTNNNITSKGKGEQNCNCGLPTDETARAKIQNWNHTDYKICKAHKGDSSYQGSGDKYSNQSLQEGGEGRYAPCRRIEITATCEQTETNVINNALSNGSALVTDVVTGLTQQK